MALVNCSECGKERSTQAGACPHCGAKVKKTKLWLWVPLGLGAAFLALGAVVGNTPEGKARTQDRRVIEMCWEDQKRKSFDPGTQRFVAGMCEGLERDFVRKYGQNP